jgi:hypothetical protein
MRRLAPISFAVALSALLATGASARPITSFRVGNWAGGAFTNDQTGQFADCAGSAQFANSLVLTLLVAQNQNLALGFGSPGWTNKVGETVPIAIIIDGKKQYTFLGRAIAPNAILMPAGAVAGFAEDLRDGALMQAAVLGQSYDFSLKDTAALIGALRACVQQQLAMNGGSVPRPNSAGQIPPPGPVPDAPAPAPASPATDLALTAARIANKLLLLGGFHDGEILPPDQMAPNLRTHVARWRADGLSGAVNILSAGVAPDADHLAQLLANAVGNGCKGDFLGEHAHKIVDDNIVTRVVTVCKDSARTNEQRFFIVQNPRYGWIVFSLAAEPAPPATGTPAASAAGGRDLAAGDDWFQDDAVKASVGVE